MDATLPVYLMLGMVLLGAGIGSILGAWLGSERPWKGLTIFAGATLLHILFSNVVLQLAGLQSSVLDVVAYIVFAGLIARALNVTTRRCAVIVIGGILGGVLFAVPAVLLFGPAVTGA